jgi:hypothetical protein
MKKCFNILIFLFCAFAAIAQAPQKFNYQAVARNALGAVLPNQNVKIRASILDGSAQGTNQYSETHSATTNQLGLFNLAIGGGTVVSGNFSNVTWASADKYLKIEMDATGGNNFILVGASQLLSVPYALNAINHAWYGIGTTQSPISINDNKYTLGKVGIGSSEAPNAPLSLGSSVGSNQLNFNSCDSDINYAGFGQSCPTTIKGLGTILIDFDNNNNSNDQHFVITHQGGTEIFRVDDNENVGIGTSAPKSKLQVKNGDIYIESVNSGVIMKSPNGQCWRMTVSNTGQPVYTSIVCPL